MTEPIQISPDVLRAVANHHDEVADKIAAARVAGDDIAAAVNSFGPIMHQVKAAVVDLLTQRDAALRDHDQTHRTAAEELRKHAHGFAAVDEDSVDRLKLD